MAQNALASNNWISVKNPSMIQSMMTQNALAGNMLIIGSMDGLLNTNSMAAASLPLNAAMMNPFSLSPMLTATNPAFPLSMGGVLPPRAARPLDLVNQMVHSPAVAAASNAGYRPSNDDNDAAKQT